MNRREIINLSLLAGGALFLFAQSNLAGADSRHPTGGDFAPPSPPIINPWAEELCRMPVKIALPGGANDLILPANGGVAPNGTVYPQICGNDALTTYWDSLDRIVVPQQLNSGNNIQFPPKRYYVLNARVAKHVFHPDAPYSDNGGSAIWGYDGIFPGPTFISRYGEPILVRVINELFDDPRANPITPDDVGDLPQFGSAQITTHLHNGHSASESDGNPADFYPPQDPPEHLPPYPASIRGIRFRDHHYAMFRAGLDPHKPAPDRNDGDVSETVSTLWYHDHSEDHTAENVYKGLVGFHLIFDKADSGNENDSDAKALRLPSGNFDIPLMIQDKRFTENGQLLFDTNASHAGRLGDMIIVNGQIQPKLTVLRRKYRFRFLNAGPSRFYQLFLTTINVDPKKNVDHEFKHIGNDESLLEEPLTVKTVLLSVSERADVVIDFSQFRNEKVFLVNRLVMQDSGQGPESEFDETDPEHPKFVKFKTLPADESEGKGDYILRFDVGDDIISDPSQVPAKLRANPTLPAELFDTTSGMLKTQEELKSLPKIPHREFIFSKKRGLWVVNDLPFDNLQRIHFPRQGPPGGFSPGDGEVWTVRNADPAWSHPIHIHLEEFRILRRQGILPDPYEGSKKDVLLLRPDEEVQIFLRFRDFLGKYPIHCHNVLHEDHEMMMRFDVVR
jgi:FtsP/CotA-like multicopper oxidase with cupredoxin domain